MCKRLVYYAANAMDQKGFKDARREIAMVCNNFVDLVGILIGNPT